MNARDELANILMDDELLYGTGADKDGRDYALAEADAVLAAGYVKPRTITTAEELDALPTEAVVRSSVGVVWEKYADDYAAGEGIDFWQQVGLQRMYASSKVTLPATVLHEPEASK